MRNGLFTATQPVGVRRSAVSCDASVADEPSPVWQGIRARNLARRQVTANRNPRLKFRREAFGDSSNVRQNRLAAFLNRQPAKLSCIHLRRTQKLRGRAEIIERIRQFAKAKSHADFFIRDRS